MKRKIEISANKTAITIKIPNELVTKFIAETHSLLEDACQYHNCNALNLSERYQLTLMIRMMATALIYGRKDGINKVVKELELEKII